MNDLDFLVAYKMESVKFIDSNDKPFTITYNHVWGVLHYIDVHPYMNEFRKSTRNLPLALWIAHKRLNKYRESVPYERY
jgi:hypothetical protein